MGNCYTLAQRIRQIMPPQGLHYVERGPGRQLKRLFAIWATFGLLFWPEITMSTPSRKL